MSRSVRAFREHQVVTRAYALVLLGTRDGAFLYLQRRMFSARLPDWTETERVRQQEKERFVRIAGFHIKTNTGGRKRVSRKIFYRKGVNKNGIYEELQARGLIAQVTNEEEIRKTGKRGKGRILHRF